MISYRKTKGAALQIVLVVFCYVLLLLNQYILVYRSDLKALHSSQTLMKQNQIEILLVDYYIHQIEESLLLSDYYEEDGALIDYTVDDMGSFYEIVTHIEFDHISYAFLVQIDIQTYDVLCFKYL